MRPREYFSTMSIEGGLGEPILKALVYGIISGVFVLIWSLLNVTGVAGGLLGGTIGALGFFWTIFGAVIGVFIGAVLVLIVSAICGGNSEFEPNMRVAAAIMVLMPINAFLGFFNGINFALGSVVSLAVNLYAIYMLYLAVRGVLSAKEQPARIVSYVLSGVLVLFLIIGLATRSAVKRVTRWDQEKVEKMMNDLEQDLDEAQKAEGEED